MTARPLHSQHSLTVNAADRQQASAIHSVALQDWGADEATITGAFTEEGQPRGLRGLPETIALPPSSALRPSLVSDDTEQCTLSLLPVQSTCVWSRAWRP